MLDSKRVFTNLLPDLNKAEEERQVRRRKVLPFKRFTQFCHIGILILATYVFWLNQEPFIMVFLVVLALLLTCLIPYIIKRHFESLKFKKYFQKEVASKLIRNMDPNFSYKASGEIPLDIIKNTHLIKHFRQYHCEDLVQGQIAGKPVEFAEIILQYSVRRGRSSSHIVIAFSGVFLAIELQGSFPAPFRIVPKDHYLIKQTDDDKALGLYVEGQVLKIDHKEFDQTFTVFCDDPSLTQPLLPDPLLDRIITLNNDLKNGYVIARDLMFAFIDNKIYIAMPMMGKLMEPGLSYPVNKEYFIKRQVRFLEGIYNVGQIMG